MSGSDPGQSTIRKTKSHKKPPKTRSQCCVPIFVQTKSILVRWQESFLVGIFCSGSRGRHQKAQVPSQVGLIQIFLHASSLDTHSRSHTIQHQEPKFGAVALASPVFALSMSTNSDIQSLGDVWCLRTPCG